MPGIAKEMSHQRLSHQIWKADLMFRAYHYDLSAIGKERAQVTSRAYSQLKAGKSSTPDINRFHTEVLAKMPDPKGTNLLDESPDSWLRWFAISSENYNGEITDPIGDGCLEPCSFCERGNISGWSRDNPLYVVAAAIRNSYESRKRLGGSFFLYYQGVFGNNVIEWMDPFFHFDIGSLAASLAMLDCNIIFAPIIKAFNPNDSRMLDAVKRFSGVNSPNYSNSLILSFHLGIGSPGFDIIRAICDAGGGRIPDEIINRYAERYGMNFEILGSAINRVFLYGIGFGIREGELAEDIPFDKNKSNEVFNWATRQVFLRALAFAGIDIRKLPFKLETFDRRPLHHGGRGFDFFRRLDRAFYYNEYLEADPKYGQDNIEERKPYTRVSRKLDGTIKVVNPRPPKETLVQTTLEKLWRSEP